MIDDYPIEPREDGQFMVMPDGKLVWEWSTEEARLRALAALDAAHEAVSPSG